MIKYVKRKDLDVVKYDACITNSAQSRVYAFSWYLDIVADNWGVLVLDDYETVMPLPWNSKFGLRYITQPYFCQHLNIYSNQTTSEIIVDDFFKAIPIYFVLMSLNLGININNKNIITKNNYTLSLNKPYLKNYKNYRKDRKKSLRKATEAKLIYKDFENKNELINLYKNIFGFLNMPQKYFNTIDSVTRYCLKHNKGFIRNVFFNDELVSSGFFLKNNTRIYYLFAASNKLGKKYGATTFLLDSVIKEYANTDTTLDFEGSTISSIASFYKSFGGDLDNYYNYKLNVFKRIFF